MLRTLTLLTLLCATSHSTASDPTEPRNLTGTQYGQGPTVILSWQKPTTWPQLRLGYLISQRDLTNPNNYTPLALVSPNTTTYNTGLNSDYTYILRVQAISLTWCGLKIGEPATTTINAP